MGFVQQVSFDNEPLSIFFSQRSSDNCPSMLLHHDHDNCRVSVILQGHFTGTGTIVWLSEHTGIYGSLKSTMIYPKHSIIVRIIHWVHAMLTSFYLYRNFNCACDMVVRLPYLNNVISLLSVVLGTLTTNLPPKNMFMNYIVSVITDDVSDRVSHSDCGSSGDK